MKSSLTAWSEVWANSNVENEYSFEVGRNERAQNKIAHIKSTGLIFNDNDKVLEAGCGDGSVIIALKKMFQIDGHGVDFTKSAELQAYRLMASKSCDFKFTLADICDLPFPDQYFDKIICLGVVEHMLDPVVPLRELRRVLKRGGSVVIMTPNSLSFGRIDRIIKQWLNLWSMGYQDEFSPTQLSHLLEKAGFKLVKKMALPRPAMPNDSWSRRIVSYFDFCIRLIFKQWGFYSYTWTSGN